MTSSLYSAIAPLDGNNVSIFTIFQYAAYSDKEGERRLLSGPHTVTTSDSETKRKWYVQIERDGSSNLTSYHFTITIDEATDISDVLGRVDKIPTPYLAGLEIVSSNGQENISEFPNLIEDLSIAIKDEIQQETLLMNEWHAAIEGDNVTVYQFNSTVDNDLKHFAKLYAYCLEKDLIENLQSLSPLRFFLCCKLLKKCQALF